MADAKQQNNEAGTTVIHTIAPVFDERSRVLILGTMPSPKSREAGFYYGHPQNRFWRVLAGVFACGVPESNEAKKAFLLERHIAVWDVLRSCSIRGADDSSIQNPEANDLRVVLSAAPIHTIFTTGTKATTLYRKHCSPATGMESVYLPSPSPANCATRLETLVQAYAQAFEAAGL